jgi:hypothetical protein
LLRRLTGGPVTSDAEPTPPDEPGGLAEHLRSATAEDLVRYLDEDFSDLSDLSREPGDAP